MGYEYITQPQVFLAPITAVGGINGNLPPFYTSFYSWTTSVTVSTTQLYLDNVTIPLLGLPASYIVSVGGVVQAPANYTVDPNTRILTFTDTVNADTDITVTQIGTVAASSLSLTNLTATNSVFDNVISVNSNTVNLTAIDSLLQNITGTNLRVLSSTFVGSTTFNTVTATNLTVLSATTLVSQTIVVPTSVVNLTAVNNALFLGPISAVNLVNINNNLTVNGIVSATGVVYASGGDSNLWNYNTTLLQANSANWESTYATVCSLSSFWEESADITAITTVVESNSANWDSAYVTTTALSSNFWNETYSLVQTNSASWDYQGTDIKTLTANWESTYTTVCSLSTSWEESAEILPTVTDYLSTNNVVLSGLTTESITVTSNNIFGTTSYVNTVSALAITVNGTVLYLPLLSAV